MLSYPEWGADSIKLQSNLMHSFEWMQTTIICTLFAISDSLVEFLIYMYKYLFIFYSSQI